MQPNLIIQLVAIAADIFGIVAGFVRIFISFLNFLNVVRSIYTIILAGILLLGELYIFKFFRYFGFFFKNWGKALAYLFMGAALFEETVFGWISAIIFWAVAVAYFILGFFFKTVSYPLFQGGLCGNPPPSMALESTEIYDENQKQMEMGGGGGGNNNASHIENNNSSSNVAPANDQNYNQNYNQNYDI